MPIFRYSAFAKDGAAVEGRLEADGVRDAARRLRQDGIYPREILPLEENSPRALRRLGKERERLLPGITRNLATMISAGVPLVEALEGIARDQTGAWHRLIVGIKERVASGASLSTALGEHPQVFSKVYVGLVAAGEASGALAKVLERLAGFLEDMDKVRSQVRTALIYPIVMTVVSAGVLSFLLTFVVPKIAAVFENSDAELPWITRALLVLSSLFHAYWWLILPAALVVAWGIARLLKRQRERIDGLVLDLPVLSTAVRTLATARLARTLAMLIEGGLPIVRALEHAGEAAGNAKIREAVNAAALRIVEGSKISTAFEVQGVFPGPFINLMSTGERTGRLGEVMDHAAAAYEAEFERLVSRAMAVFEPALIVAMGVTVGTIVVAILLPIFEMNQLVG